LAPAQAEPIASAAAIFLEVAPEIEAPLAAATADSMAQTHVATAIAAAPVWDPEAAAASEVVAVVSAAVVEAPAVEAPAVEVAVGNRAASRTTNRRSIYETPFHESQIPGAFSDFAGSGVGVRVPASHAGWFPSCPEKTRALQYGAFRGREGLRDPAKGRGRPD
jgi:hypothetical protein